MFPNVHNTFWQPFFDLLITFNGITWSFWVKLSLEVLFLVTFFFIFQSQGMLYRWEVFNRCIFIEEKIVIQGITKLMCQTSRTCIWGKKEFSPLGPKMLSFWATALQSFKTCMVFLGIATIIMNQMWRKLVSRGNLT